MESPFVLNLSAMTVHCNRDVHSEFRRSDDARLELEETAAGPGGRFVLRASTVTRTGVFAVVREIMLFGKPPEVAVQSPMVQLLGDGFVQDAWQCFDAGIEFEDGQVCFQRLIARCLRLG